MGFSRSWADVPNVGQLESGENVLQCVNPETPPGLPPRKLTWLAGKSSFLVGDASSNGWFSIVNVSVSIINPPPQIFFFSDLAQKRGGGTIVSSEMF